MTRRPRRWSRKDREDAAVICSIMACTPEAFVDYEAAAASIGARPELGLNGYQQSGEPCLSLKAWRHAYESYPQSCGNDVLDAEAESLLRTGWLPEESDHGR